MCKFVGSVLEHKSTSPRCAQVGINITMVCKLCIRVPSCNHNVYKSVIIKHCLLVYNRLNKFIAYLESRCIFLNYPFPPKNTFSTLF